MIIDNKYQIGDTVYLKTDTDQLQYMVVELYVSMWEIAYRIVCGTNEYTAREIELSAKRDELKPLM